MHEGIGGYMKRVVFLLLISVFLIIIPAACEDKDNPFVGTWIYEAYIDGELDATYEIVFKKNMTFAFSGYKSGGITSGPYSFDDEILEIHETEMDGKPEEGYHSKPPYIFRDEDYFQLRYGEGMYVVCERKK